MEYIPLKRSEVRCTRAMRSRRAARPPFLFHLSVYAHRIFTADDAEARAPPPPPGGVLSRLLLYVDSASETRPVLAVAEALFAGAFAGVARGKSPPPLWCGLLRSIPRKDSSIALGVSAGEGGAP